METKSKKKVADAVIKDATVPATRAQRVKKVKKEQISLTLPPVLITRVDELAYAMGQSRASWICGAIYKALKEADVQA